MTGRSRSFLHFCLYEFALHFNIELMVNWVGGIWIPGDHGDSHNPNHASEPLVETWNPKICHLPLDARLRKHQMLVVPVVY